MIWIHKLWFWYSKLIHSSDIHLGVSESSNCKLFALRMMEPQCFSLSVTPPKTCGPPPNLRNGFVQVRLSSCRGYWTSGVWDWESSLSPSGWGWLSFPVIFFLESQRFLPGWKHGGVLLRGLVLPQWKCSSNMCWKPEVDYRTEGL